MSKRGYVKCGYCSDYYLKGGGGEGHLCFLKQGDSIFGNDSHHSSTIHALNVIYYDIENHLEDRFECRFQSIDENGNMVSIQQSVSFAIMDQVESFCNTLTEHEQECMDVVTCKSLTLLCVVNGSHSIRKLFSNLNHLEQM